MPSPRDQWLKAVDWALAAGLPAEAAIEAADRKAEDYKKIRAACAERFDAVSGQPKTEFPGPVPRPSPELAGVVVDDTGDCESCQ